MNQKLIKMQVLAGGLLSLCLVAEWSYSRFADAQLQSRLAPLAQSDSAAEELPSMSNSKSSAESYSEIVDRPVFLEGRRPIVEAPPSDTAQAQDVGQIDDWALIGVYNKDERPTALFSKRNETRKFLKITEEQSISGWQLKKIQSDHVVLQQAGQEKSVVLRKPRAQVSPQAGGKPAATRAPRPNPAAKPVEPAPDENPENNQ